ncbi:MAG: PIN domain-containing protein [Thermoanaerobaculia bacterium]
MVTNRKIFARPLTPAQAVANVEQLLALPYVEVLAEEAGFWESYRQVGGMAATGKMVPDTHLAALLLEHDVRVLYSNDSDFKVFDFLEVRNPFRDGL